MYYRKINLYKSHVYLLTYENKAVLPCFFFFINETNKKIPIFVSIQVENENEGEEEEEAIMIMIQ